MSMELRPHMECSLEELTAELKKYSNSIVRPIMPLGAHYARTALYLIGAMLQSDHNITQMCGQVLGYPRYADDPTNFPNCDPHDPEVCVGDHVPESIVAELCERYRKVIQK